MDLLRNQKPYEPPITHTTIINKADEKPAQEEANVNIGEVNFNIVNDIKILASRADNLGQKNANDIANILKELEALKNENSNLKQRMGDAETAIDFLKKLGAPSGSDGAGAGLFDALNDMTEKLRKEMNEKIEGAKDGLNAKMDD